MPHRIADNSEMRSWQSAGLLRACGAAAGALFRSIMITDPRLNQLAELLTGFSTSLKENERVLIDAFDVPEAMVVALIRAARGGRLAGLPRFTRRGSPAN